MPPARTEQSVERRLQAIRVDTDRGATLGALGRAAERSCSWELFVGAVRGSDWIGEDCTSTLPRLASSTSAQHSASSGNPVIYNCSSSLVVAVENFDLR